MTTLHDRDPTALARSTARVAEIMTLFARIRALLDHSLRITDDLTDETPRTIVTRMDQLIAAHLKVLAAEEAFNAAQNANHSDIHDLDSIRDDLGRRLDRLRASLDSEGVSGQPDAS